MVKVHTFLMVSYHYCIITIPHDSDANFRVKLGVKCISFQLNSCFVVWQINAGRDKIYHLDQGLCIISFGKVMFSDIFSGEIVYPF